MSNSTKTKASPPLIILLHFKLNSHLKKHIKNLRRKLPHSSPYLPLYIIINFYRKPLKKYYILNQF